MLAKSLHALPSPDFNLCLGLLGEAPVSILPQKPSAGDEEQKEDGANETTSANAAAAESSQTGDAKTAAKTPQQPSAGILTDPTILKLHHLATLLSSSRYPTFWTTLESSEYADIRSDVLKNITNFEDGIRKVVLNGTSGAFKSISKQRLGRYLGLQSVDSFLQSPLADGWIAKGDVVEIPANKDNVIKPAGVVREEVGLGELNRLLQQAAPSAPQAA